MKLYKLGGVLMLVMMLFHLYQHWRMIYPAFFSGHPLAVVMAIKHGLFGLYIDFFSGANKVSLRQFLSFIPLSGIVFTLQFFIALKVLKGGKLGMPTRIFLGVMALLLFGGHMLECVLMVQWTLVPLYVPIWYQVEIPFYLTLVATLMLVVNSPSSDSTERRQGLRWLLVSLAGRISRRTYWGYQVLLLGLFTNFCYLMTMLVLGKDFNALDSLFKERHLIASVHVLAATIWPTIALGAKRCHDRDKRAWYQLLWLIPVVNLFYVLEMLCFKGTQGENRFGPDPLNSEKSGVQGIEKTKSWFQR